MNNESKIRPDPINPSWKELGFTANLEREKKSQVEQGKYIAGAQFNTQLSELLFNRMIKLKNLPAATPPQGNEPGKIYWDKDNEKYKLWVNKTVGFVDVLWSSTSTTTTSSSSSSSSSTSSTSSSSSSSTSSTSSSSSSSSTSTTHT